MVMMTLLLKIMIIVYIIYFQHCENHSHHDDDNKFIGLVWFVGVLQHCNSL